MDELKQLIQSNAKAIETLTADIQEMKRDRDVMYNLMSELTSKQISTYTIMKNLDDRQDQLTE